MASTPKPAFVATCAFALLLLAGAQADASKPTPAATRICYSECEVQLRGRIAFVDGYGVPGFGETPEIDAKLRVPILNLRVPLAVPDDGWFLAATDERQVQIENFLDLDLHQFDGVEVVVTGKLIGAITASHIRAVLIRPDHIERIEGENATCPR